MKLRKSNILAVIVCASISSATISAEANYKNYSEPFAAQPVNTGLGECIDFLIYGSSHLSNQVSSVGYSFQYAAGAFTDLDNKVIYIQNYTCPEAPSDDLAPLYGRISQVAHELGHVVWAKPVRIDTRENYIEDGCESEGAGVSNNIIGRDEILETSGNGVDIGLVGNDAVEAQMEAIYRSTSPPQSYRQMGQIFCPENITSTTGERYTDYFGRIWDDKYGGRDRLIAKTGRENVDAEASPADFDVYSLWKFIDEMAAHVKQGREQTFEHWPVKGITVPNQNKTPFRRISAGSFMLGWSLQIESSEIRLNRSGQIVIVSIDIAPTICISRQVVIARYGDLKLSSIPTGHSILEKTYWAIHNRNGKVSFGFSEQRPECLANIVLNPSGQ